MNARKRRERFEKERIGRYSVGLLLLVVIASLALLVVINHYTIKTLSALRAYTNGESHYSKGQKTASLNLILYLDTGEEQYWEGYEREISVPIGDRQARLGLEAGDRGEKVKAAFIQGRNHPDDVGDMIWLYHWFHGVEFMDTAISIWAEADGLVIELDELARGARDAIAAEGALSVSDWMATIDRLSVLTARLTDLEAEFSSTLGDAARRISSGLFYANVFLALLTIGSVAIYASSILVRLKRRNRELAATNRELDHFLYSASHDLRAPISSLKGLVEVALLEESAEGMKGYLRLMGGALEQQDEFIREIIAFSRNKRRELVFTEVSLRSILRECVAQHQYLAGAAEVEIQEDIQIDAVRCDELRLRIICNNLISNAFKYSDSSKERPTVTLRTFVDEDRRRFSIAFEDNGIGIADDHRERIFEMFYATADEAGGSGLGLYIANETALRLGGSIEVASERGKGSVFTVNLPMNDEG